MNILDLGNWTNHSVQPRPLSSAFPHCFMTLGIFYILGSLEYLHGHNASERTFLGIIPMFTSTNLIIQMLKSASLKRRLKGVEVMDDPSPHTVEPAHQPSW